MTFLRKTTQAATALLVLLMSTMLVLPPGMDLELCFGKDGHIYFSLNSCQDGSLPKIPVRERPPVYDTTQHDECFHVAVACSTARELIRTDGKTVSDKSNLNRKKDPSQTPLLFPKSLAGSADAYLASNDYSIPVEDLPSYQLVSLRTVVLLI